MEHDLAVAHRFVDDFVTPDIAFDQLYVVGETEQIRAIAGGEVVEHTDRVPVLNQLLGQVRADESAPTRHERADGHQPPTLRSIRYVTYRSSVRGAAAPVLQ